MPSAHQLIAELIDESIRARQRRLHVTGSTECTLYALKAVDAKLDNNIRALASFGSDALTACEARVDASQGVRRDAAVHLHCAVAVQSADHPSTNQLLLQLVRRHHEQHTLAVRDALWFFPAGATDFDIRHGHIDLLLGQSDPTLQLFGVWAGLLRGALQAAAWATDHLSPIEHDPQSSDDALRRCCELALANLAAELPPDERCRWLLGGNVADRRHALDLLASSGKAAQHLGVDGCLTMAECADAALQRQAWFTASSMDPVACAAAARRSQTLSDEWRTSLLALGGAPEDLIRIVAAVCANDQPPRPECSDALHLMLGHVPVAVRQTPIDRLLRESQLRSDVLHAFRRAHVNVQNQADECAWDPSLWLAPESLNSRVRLRYGQRLVDRQVIGLPAEIASRLSAMVRQALYWEQARAEHTSFGRGLSAYAHARMQYLALDAAEFRHEHLASRVA